jgi:hypothetical protein
VIAGRPLRAPLALVMATGCLTGAVLVVNDSARAVITTVPTGTWFANDSAGSVSHLGPGGVDATVGLTRPVGNLDVIELDGVAYITDEAANLWRVDPAQLDVSDQAVLPAVSQLVAGGGRMYAVDTERSTVRELDPDTLVAIGEPVTAGTDLGRAVVDGEGVLWVPDRASGAVVSVDGATVDGTRVVAEPGVDLRLAVVGTAVTAIDRSSSTVTVVQGPAQGERRTLPSPANSTLDAPDHVEDGSILPIVSNGATLVTVDVASGTTSQVTLPATGHRLGTARISQGRVYVPDFTDGAFIVVDVATGRVVDTIVVTGRAGDFEVVIDGGTVYVNDPRSEDAWSIDSSGNVLPVDKYDPAAPGTGGGVASTIPVPPSIPPAPTLPRPPSSPQSSTTTSPRGSGSTTSSTTTTTQPRSDGSDDREDDDGPAVPTVTDPPVVVIPVPTPPPPTGPDGTGSPGTTSGGQTTAPDGSTTSSSTTTSPGSTTTTGSTTTSTTTPSTTTPTSSSSTTTTTAPTTSTSAPTTTTTAPTTTTVVAPGAPGGVLASAGDGVVRVSWIAANANGGTIREYAVRNLTDGIRQTVSGSETSATFPLANGTTYSFDVVAIGGTGLSGPASAAVSATPTGPPAAPTGVSASASSPTAISVSFDQVSPTNGTTVASWRIVTSPDTGPHQVSSTSASITGLSPGTAYTITVVALGANGMESGASAPASVTTPTGVPGAVTSVVVGSTQITWAAAADATGYRVVINGGAPQEVTGTSIAHRHPTYPEAETYVTVTPFNAYGDGTSGSDIRVNPPDDPRCPTCQIP